MSAFNIQGFNPSEGWKIQIYNSLGERVLNEGARYAEPLRIDVSGLPPEIYVVKIVSRGETFTEKFVVAK